MTVPLLLFIQSGPVHRLPSLKTRFPKMLSKNALTDF